MDLDVGGPEFPRFLNIFGGDVLSALLYLSGDDQQRLQLGRDLGVLKIMLHLLHQRLIVIEAGGGDRAMDCLTVITIIL